MHVRSSFLSQSQYSRPEGHRSADWLNQREGERGRRLCSSGVTVEARPTCCRTSRDHDRHESE